MDAGLSNFAIALFYQVGYLILPPLTPILIWVFLNRPYIEQLSGLQRGSRPLPGKK
jgi:hypothetical protein